MKLLIVLVSSCVLFAIVSEGLVQAIAELLAFATIAYFVLRKHQPAKGQARNHYPQKDAE